MQARSTSAVPGTLSVPSIRQPTPHTKLRSSSKGRSTRLSTGRSTCCSTSCSTRQSTSRYTSYYTGSSTDCFTGSSICRSTCCSTRRSTSRSTSCSTSSVLHIHTSMNADDEWKVCSHCLIFSSENTPRNHNTLCINRLHKTSVFSLSKQ